MGAVAIIAATGLFNAYLRSAGLDSLLATAYGRVLALKIATFLVLVALAVANRWIYLRRLQRDYSASNPIASLSWSVAGSHVGRRRRSARCNPST